MKKVIIFVIIFLLLGGTAAYIIRQRRISTNTVGSEDNTPQVTVETPIPENWRTYQNDLGYKIKMPPNVLVNTEVGESSVHLVPETESGQFGVSNFIYISVIDREGIKNNERVYNYNSDQFLEMMDMEVGATQSVVPKQKNVPELEEWFMYERLEDINVSGQDSRVFLNRKPWEFPLSVAEIRYVVPTEETVYILGAYFGGDASTASLTRKDVEKIISTFKIQ